MRSSSPSLVIPDVARWAEIPDRARAPAIAAIPDSRSRGFVDDNGGR